MDLVLTIGAGLAGLMLGVAIGLFVGLLNGWGTTKLRLPHPFIMTLGMLNIARGLTNLVSGGAPVSGLPDTIRFLGYARINLSGILGVRLYLPVSMLVLIVAYICVSIFLKKTSVGRHIYAVGGNPHAARVSGVNVDRVLVFVYMLCGFFAGLAGLLLVGRTGSGFPNAGLSAELDAIAAVIIGLLAGILLHSARPAAATGLKKQKNIFDIGLSMGGLFMAAFTWHLRRDVLVPVKDPRLPESLAFENF